MKCSKIDGRILWRYLCKPTSHGKCRLSGKGDHQKLLRRDLPLMDQIKDPLGNGKCLAGAGTRQY